MTDKTPRYDLSAVVAAASGRWPEIFHALGINIPTGGAHGACPVCGGKDRFRCDKNSDKGRWYCNQCGSHDGLDLVARVNRCSLVKAARQVESITGAVNGHHSDGQPSARSAPAATPQKPDDKRDNAEALAKINRMLSAAAKTPSESAYLQGKGLTGYRLPLLADGSLILPMVTLSGEVTGAQIIKPDGAKKLLAGSHKRGAFICTSTTPPDNTATVIITEGYATALTVSLIYRDACTVAALDAQNLLPVCNTFREAFPEARIIIAADNDAGGRENTGVMWAEKSARSAGAWVTRPPTDDKADWDDYRQRVGIPAATAAFHAGLYQPAASTPANPAPRADAMKPYIDYRSDGLFWIEPKPDRESGGITHKEGWLCDPLAVTGVGDSGEEQYLLIEWTPEGHKEPHTEIMPKREIGEREGWARLRRKGLAVTSNTALRTILANHLQRAGKREYWRIALSTGWQNGAYILPDGSVIGEPETPVKFSGRSAAASAYRVRGTVESWRDTVGALAEDNACMMLGVACSLAAPLLNITEMDSFGVHLFGDSGRGKSTIAYLANSVWGHPTELLLSWFATEYGLTNEAAAHNDGLLSLDEIGQSTRAKSVASAAYALFNGTGKIQGAKDGGNRDTLSWRVLALSTGEKDLETYLSAAGESTHAGQLVRLLNVPILAVEHAHGHADTRSHADALQTATKAHYGALGREWVAYLSTCKPLIAETARHTVEAWQSRIPAKASDQVRRVASRFALLETALVMATHLTGWTAEQCQQAVQRCFNEWLYLFGLENREDSAIVRQAVAFLSAYGLSRYAPVKYDPRDLPINNLAGYRQGRKETPGSDETDIRYYTFPHVFKDEIAKGYNQLKVAQTLFESGVLEKPDSAKARGYMKKSPRVNGKQHTVYVLMLPDDDEGGDEENA
ncbi:DUF927 domain-containing protein [Salmonella enterica]|nr:DUF927 domain-containing protein [Salmonella enterica]EJH7016133.1 DUF927 domain-containing protein [Salmonella enterica]EJH7437810.1 DUF927 domain-containing protein [Salmonella enterica]EJH7877105.1 DUF927 domain-containing protein [Salmonella enterica]EJH7880983.1 DUF927 domain-containing protein [Salmonella enterica]